MPEGLIALTVIVVLVASILAALWLPWELLLVTGFVGISAGLLLGLPTGFLYHLRLRQCLLMSPPLPPRWWLRPTRFHDRIGEAQRRRVMVPFYLGAAGFFLILFGAGVVALGLLDLW